MKILYLCNKHIYDTKMSRVRFHSMDAVAKVVDVIYAGIGWENYNNDETVSSNIANLYGDDKPDFIVAYKPLSLKEFPNVDIPKCMRYNEMWDVKWTTKEIRQSGVNLVICHHLNDISKYDGRLENVSFVNISHCAEQSVYMDYGLNKDIDVLLTGAISKHYPFRGRLGNLLVSRLSNKVRCKILKHPGGDLRSVRAPVLEDYAKFINRSKITLTCSSLYNYRLGKYVEIPMSGSLLAADLPGEDYDFFKKFMLVLDPKDSNAELENKILNMLNNDEERNRMTNIGIEANKEYTQEKYAERFLAACAKYLEEHG